MGMAPFGPGYWLATGTTLTCFGTTGIAARLMLGETLPVWSQRYRRAWSATRSCSTSVVPACNWPSWSGHCGLARQTAHRPEPPHHPGPSGQPTLTDEPTRRPIKIHGSGTLQSTLRRTYDPVRREARPTAWSGTPRNCALRSYGELTAGLRRGPDFVIIGAKRGGSTSLYNYVLEHPRLLRCFRVVSTLRAHIITIRGSRRGLTWYRSHFPIEIASPAVRPRPHPAVDLRRGKPLLPVPSARGGAAGQGLSGGTHHRGPARSGRPGLLPFQGADAPRRETLSFEDALAAEEHRRRREAKHIVAEPGY